MRLGKPWIVALALAVAATLSAGAFAQGKEAPEKMMGTIKVGDKAPDFTLKGQDGKDHTLSDYTKNGKVAVVFYRSANW